MMNEQKRKEWLERRKSGIGASDSPKILGLSSFGSALSTYLNKIGESEDSEMNERMQIGIEMEPAIVNIFKNRTQKRIRRVSKEIWSKKYPFLFATPDGLVIGEKAGLECKNIGIYKTPYWDWGEGIPDQYMIQCQHSMVVTGLKKWYLAALFSGNRFEYYEVNYDQELIDIILPKLKSFWEDNVLKRFPPVPQSIDGSILLDQYPMDTEDDEPLILSDDTEIIIKEWETAKKMEAVFKKKKDENANIMKQRLGAKKFAVVGKKSISWSRWEVERFDTERFKKENEDLFKTYIKKYQSGRINVSNKESDSKHQ